MVLFDFLDESLLERLLKLLFQLEPDSLIPGNSCQSLLGDLPDLIPRRVASQDGQLVPQDHIEQGLEHLGRWPTAPAPVQPLKQTGSGASIL
jgi:hypothetical protein